MNKPILIAYDDRELTSGEVRSLVGFRRYGEIISHRSSVARKIQEELPAWAKKVFFHLRGPHDVLSLRQKIEERGSDCSVLLLSSRVGLNESGSLRSLLDRLPYAEVSFTERLYRPLITFYQSAYPLLERWTEFEIAGVQTWESPWADFERLQTIRPLDLATIKDLLSFTTGSTSARHFNEVEIDNEFYTKRSADKRKMEAEYRFFDLVPERTQAWLVRPFDFQVDAETASYRMQRHFLADAALQWVHSAFTEESFQNFLGRFFSFIKQREEKTVTSEVIQKVTNELFVTKVERRIEELLKNPIGRRVNRLVARVNPGLEAKRQLKRYLTLFEREKKGFLSEKLVIGHGDSCLSNILYDQERLLLRLVDPKGGLSKDELWTHPYYDLCKLSQCILGDYDFINSGLYSLSLTEQNDLSVSFLVEEQTTLKEAFRQRMRELGISERILRLGEVSLFLSMLPLHIDYPNKVVAFLFVAKTIMDEIEADD